MHDLIKVLVIVVGAVLVVGAASGAVSGKSLPPQAVLYDDNDSVEAISGMPERTMILGPLNVTLQNGTFTPEGLPIVVVDNLTPLGVLHALSVNGELNYSADGMPLQNGEIVYWPVEIEGFRENLTSEPPIEWRWIDAFSLYGDWVFNEYTVTSDSELYFYFINESTPMEDAQAWFRVSVDMRPPPPEVNFTANTTSGSAPLTVQFNETSMVQNITEWHWDFGNGYFSILQNPIFTYHEPGNYSVSLNVTTGTGERYENAVEEYITVG